LCFIVLKPFSVAPTSWHLLKCKLYTDEM
jgi:hypothetical protein